MVTLLLGLLACGVEPGPAVVLQQSTPPPPEQEADPTEPMVELDDVALLARLSLDLRGVRPSLDEIAAVEADPATLDTLAESFLYDARFGPRVRDMYAQVFLTRQDEFEVEASDFGLTEERPFVEAVGNEVLYIVSTIAEEDLPYTDIVLGDWTVANEVLGEIWPLDYPDGGEGWMKVRYTDDRPAAGVMATNGMWWRYMSTSSNANRGKANALSRILLCNDYLSKEIEFDRTVNLLDRDAVNDALQNNPGCVACHHSLDPLASFLWGSYYLDYDAPGDVRYYHPEREPFWESYTGVAPGYYGVPGYALPDLAHEIASDPRLIECAVERVFGFMLQRDLELGDTAELSLHREAFLADDLRLRGLFLSVMTSPSYRAATDTAGLTATSKMVSPEVLASQVEDLTGYRLTEDGVDLLQTDDGGFRTLAGGVDGLFVTRPASEPTTTLVLVTERIAQAAAAYAVAHDRDHPDSARLFTEIDFDEGLDVDRDAIITQIMLLHLRVLGHRVDPDGPEVAANLELWDALYLVRLRPEDAWAGVLTVLMRDPDFLFY